MSEPVKVLFVCLGNICRSPTAEAVFQRKVADAGLSDRIHTDSCGTGDWHIGRAPDSRAQSHALERGYQLDHLRARQVCEKDFFSCDYVLAMDNSNLSDLQAMCPPQGTAPRLFLEFASNTALKEVPDPYYGDADGFDEVLDLVEDAADGLLTSIRATL